MSLAVFVCADLTPDRVWLVGGEGRHAAGAKRLQVGEQVELVDGRGTRARCTVVEVGREQVGLDVGQRVLEPASEPRLVVVQALPKGERGELAVELMTEVGVDEIVPWAAERCIAQWRGERGDKALRRWRNAAHEATKQARRSRLPQVAACATTGQVAERLERATSSVVLHETATDPLSSLALPQQGELVLVVGPEGGLTPAELATFAQAGARTVRLGPTVLRTSSAGAVAAAVLSARTARWG